jgi:hypothetical protein
MFAVSLIDWRTQFAHAAAENIELESFPDCFFPNGVRSTNNP